MSGTSNIEHRTPNAERRTKSGGSVMASPAKGQLFVPTITGAAKRVKLADWYWNEIKEGGFLHEYLADEKRRMPGSIRTIARIMDGFQQNNKSDFRRLAAVPARLYHRWKGEDEHFFEDDNNLRALKRDNPDLPVYVGARQMPTSRFRKSYGEIKGRSQTVSAAILGNSQCGYSGNAEHRTPNIERRREEELRTSTFKSVIDRIAGYMAEADGLSVEDMAIAVAKINFFVRLGWLHYWWPETMSIEQRSFRPAYDGSAVVATNEVFFPADCQYYQALQNSTGQVPANLVNGGYVANAPYWALSQGSYAGDDWAANTVYVSTGDAISIVRNPGDGLFYQCIVGHTSDDTFNPANWGVLTPFTRSIDYEQANKTALGLVRFVWPRDPRVNRGDIPQEFALREDYVQVYGCVNAPWLEFQGRAPEFTNLIYDDSLSYGAGVTRYDDTTGDCWTTLVSVAAGESPTSAPAKWSKVQMPYVLAEYVAQSAYAMMTDREQETPENFSIQNTAGYPLLLVEIDNIERKQGQTRQLNVKRGMSGVAMTPYSF
jgi:hypothetical protein